MGPSFFFYSPPPHVQPPNQEGDTLFVLSTLHNELPPPPLACPSNTYVQATLGVGSVNFCNGDFGGAFLLCAICDC